MTHEGLMELVESIDVKHREGHTRLREEITDLTDRLETLRTRVEGQQGRLKVIAMDLEHLRGAPVNIDKLLFTPRVVAAVLISLLSVYGFFLASTSGLRSDIRDILTQMSAQQTAAKARADLQDVQSATIRSDVNDLKRQIQLQGYEIQTLKDLVKKGR